MTTLDMQTGGGGPTHLSAYRLMWLLVTFDLPVETRKQRKAAHDFRMYLLDLGFEMSQLSNYLRFCNGKEQFDSYVRKIESNLPPPAATCSYFSSPTGSMKILCDSPTRPGEDARKTPTNWRYSEGSWHSSLPFSAQIPFEIRNLSADTA